MVVDASKELRVRRQVKCRHGRRDRDPVAVRVRVDLALRRGNVGQ